MAEWLRLRGVLRLDCLGLAAILGVSAGCAGLGREYARADLVALVGIGYEIRKAALAGDIDALLRYARRDIQKDPGLVEPMRPALTEYLRGNVREVLTTARDLQLHVEDLGRDDEDVRWARLIFYDRAAVSRASLAHRDFLCKHDLKHAVAWTFQFIDGWESVGYPFDAFTDIHCPPETADSRS